MNRVRAADLRTIISVEELNGDPWALDLCEVPAHVLELRQ
jgi:hypothetical protein